MRPQESKTAGLLGTVILVTLITLIGCSENPFSPAKLETGSTVAKSSGVTMTPTNLRLEFEQLAKKLAERAPNVIEKLMTNYEALSLENRRLSISLSELGLVTDLPSELQLANGRVLRTTLERAQPCQVMPASTSSPIIFAPDPDRFQPDDANHICAGYLVKDGKVTSVSFTLDEYRTEFSGIPLFLVGGIEEADAVSSNRPSAQNYTLSKGFPASVQSVRYAACHKIRMKTDHDPWSNEETEVYLSDPTISGLFKKETNWIFSGHWRNDAAGRYVYFDDVNNSDWYVLENGIAFFALDWVNRGWVAIEDDYWAGLHFRIWPEPGPAPIDPVTIIFTAQTDVQKANGTILWDQVRDYLASSWRVSDPYISSDDIWQSGAYEDFTLAWNPLPTEFIKYALNDNDFWMVNNTW